MKRKYFDNFTYYIGNIKDFCTLKILTLLKVDKMRLTPTGKNLFESFEYYTTTKGDKNNDKIF